MKTYNQFLVESTEKLDELSLRTLKSYMTKAGGQKYIYDKGAENLMGQKASTTDVKRKQHLNRAAGLLVDKGDKRLSGMIKAGHKIHKKMNPERPVEMHTQPAVPKKKSFWDR